MAPPSFKNSSDQKRDTARFKPFIWQTSDYSLSLPLFAKETVSVLERMSCGLCFVLCQFEDYTAPLLQQTAVVAAAATKDNGQFGTTA
jgi:hypothetical protein